MIKIKFPNFVQNLIFFFIGVKNMNPKLSKNTIICEIDHEILTHWEKENVHVQPRVKKNKETI